MSKEIDWSKAERIEIKLCEEEYIEVTTLPNEIETNIRLYRLSKNLHKERNKACHYQTK